MSSAVDEENVLHTSANAVSVEEMDDAAFWIPLNCQDGHHFLWRFRSGWDGQSSHVMPYHNVVRNARNKWDLLHNGRVVVGDVPKNERHVWNAAENTYTSVVRSVEHAVIFTTSAHDTSAVTRLWRHTDHYALSEKQRLLVSGDHKTGFLDFVDLSTGSTLYQWAVPTNPTVMCTRVLAQLPLCFWRRDVPVVTPGTDKWQVTDLTTHKTSELSHSSEIVDCNSDWIVSLDFTKQEEKVPTHRIVVERISAGPRIQHVGVIPFTLSQLITSVHLHPTAEKLVVCAVNYKHMLLYVFDLTTLAMERTDVIDTSKFGVSATNILAGFASVKSLRWLPDKGIVGHTCAEWRREQ